MCLCACSCMLVHTHRCVFLCACVPMCVCACMPTRLSACVPARVRARARMHMRMFVCARACLCARMCVVAVACMHACVCVCARAPSRALAEGLYTHAHYTRGRVPPQMACELGRREACETRQEKSSMPVRRVYLILCLYVWTYIHVCGHVYLCV